MPKLKTVTTEELKDLIERAQDVQGDAADIARRLETNFSTEIESPMQRAVSALAVSRSFSDLAAVLLSRAALGEQKLEIEEQLRKRGA